MLLASLNWSEAKELKERELVAILPMGSLEEHGPIGPLGTDAIIPEEIAARLEARMSDRVLILPWNLRDEVAAAADKLASRLADKANAKVQNKALNKRLTDKYGKR